MFSEKIKELQKIRKITQAELSDKIGMTRPGLQNAFRNDDFKASTLKKIAEVLDVSITYFFEETPLSGVSGNQVGDKSIAVAGSGNNFFNQKGAEVSNCREKIQDLERIILEKDKLLEEKDKHLNEKERLIGVLMGKKGIK